MDLRTFVAELKRRNVYKVAIAYAVIARLLMQVATLHGSCVLMRLDHIVRFVVNADYGMM
jgi:hypothetical protein